MDVSPQGVQLVPPGLFDEDYEYFYADRLRPERSMLEADRIRRLGGLGPGQSVLGVPCGDGRIAALLAEAGCRVVGIDQHEDPIARAKSRSASAARFEVGDMRALGWREEFDQHGAPCTAASRRRVAVARRSDKSGGGGA